MTEAVLSCKKFTTNYNTNKSYKSRELDFQQQRGNFNLVDKFFRKVKKTKINS